MNDLIVSSTLSGRALERRVLSKYALSQPILCRFYHRGLNDTYRVTTGNDEFFLRIYKRGWRRKQDIEAEADMLSYLVKQGQPVSGPMKKKNGSYLTRISAPEGIRWAVLYAVAPGKNPRFNAPKIRQYGKTVASLHTCLDQRPIDKRRFHLDLTHLLDEPLQYIEPFLQHRKDDFDYLTRVAMDLKSGIQSLLPVKIPEYGCCHGDHHGGNVHQDEQGNMTLFDFDCYGYGWRAYDIAVFLWQRVSWFGWDKAAKAKTARRWDSFLQGYAELRSPSENELKATKFFVPAREIWLFGLHMRMRGSEMWPCIVSDGFLSGRINFVRKSIQHYRLW